MSTGGGTGQPHTFQCWNCRRRRRNRGYAHEVDPTGRTRFSNTGIGGRCVVETRYEYRCPFCGHVGWSRHRQLGIRCDDLGIPPHPHDQSGLRRFNAAQAASPNPPPSGEEPDSPGDAS